MEILHRSFIPIVLALLALTFAGAIAAFAMTVDWSELSDRTPAETESRPAAAPPVDPGGGGLMLGVQMHPLWTGVTERDAERELDVVRRSGARLVRIDVGWSTLEPAGKRRISAEYARRLDRFLAAAARRRIGVIATLHETPCWAAAAPARVQQGCRGAWWERGVQRYPPRRAADYADAATYVARRWGKRMLALEIWNEPNVRFFLNAPDPVLAYSRLVRASYRPIKRVRRELTVLAGGTLRSDGRFVEGLYQRGRILGHYDALSYHPYSAAPAEPTAERGPEFSLVAGTQWLHDIMTNAGDPEPELWATEAGASTCSPDANPECVSEADQATRIAQYVDAASGFPYVRALVVYNLRDKGTDPGDIEHGFGLVRRDLSAKPAFAEFRAAAAGR